MTENSDMIQVMSLMTDVGEKSLSAIINLAQKGGAQTLQFFMWVYMRNRKIAGGVSLKKLLHEKGGDTQILRIPTEDPAQLKKIYQDLEKRGVMFHTLEDIHVGDNQTELVFHPSDAAKVEAFLEDWQHLYVNKDKQNEIAKEEKTYSSLYQENVIGWEQYRQSIPIEEQKQLQAQAMTEVEQMYKKKPVSDEVEQKTEKILSNMEAEAAPMVKVSIDEKLYSIENEKYFISRIPYQKDKYLILPISQVKKVNDGKTAVANLSEDIPYPVVNRKGEFQEHLLGKDMNQYYGDKKDKEHRAEKRDIQNDKKKTGNFFQAVNRKYDMKDLESALLKNDIQVRGSNTEKQKLNHNPGKQKR